MGVPLEHVHHFTAYQWVKQDLQIRTRTSYPGPEVLAHPAVVVQDHKAVGEGDTGPNTGGMGAYSPAPAVTAQIQEQVMQEIVQRTADALVAEGCPYRGVLFAGLMIKDGKVQTGITFWV